MIIRITNKCTMGCSHCMVDASSPTGEHMSAEMFNKALRISRLLYSHVILLSGGEPFEHPAVFEMISETKKRGFIPIVTSNGLFALDHETRQRAQRTEALIQVTNDPRYYPRNLEMVRWFFDQKRWCFENHITHIFPCRRTRKAGIESNRAVPPCFNHRSITRQYDIVTAIVSLATQGRFCTPSIDVDGSIRAGETDTCFKIGTVDSTEGELDEALRTMRCNRCGLVNKLDDEHLAAIGEERVR